MLYILWAMLYTCHNTTPKGLTKKINIEYDAEQILITWGRGFEINICGVQQWRKYTRSFKFNRRKTACERVKNHHHEKFD